MPVRAPGDCLHQLTFVPLHCLARSPSRAVEVDWAGLAQPAPSDSGSSDPSSGDGGIDTGGVEDPLLPELALLPELRRLVLSWKGAPPWAGIPQEWLARGAFPRLEM